ncbi:MAG: 2-C-methyl-D-erythritol 4-phosphate cytidylyltransferase [Nitrospinae bacterium]|jgi:2-C-methyl-D-erythritol 4-phosphate cytidylyltransferase|nr:2-C-methyl-D-erythritol 4-phosphate cytidylyltransferase [Nitrospinota bacterium]MDA1109761.1 2-C-methyl-D-erythritol 4-phosphate cytidylyltransferase [Nitrospinota bacterium]
MKISAIIPAAGQGTRMGSAIPKQFLLLQGKPILHHTLRAFEASGQVDSVILVVPEKDSAAAKKEWLLGYDIVKKIVVGGKERQDSVYNGFQALDADTDVVLVHDGVRPFVTGDMILRAIEAAKNFGAAITAIPVNDTIKLADADGFVEKTVDRSGLWRVQTPQAFQYAVLNEAFQKAVQDSYYGTDEGSLLEYAGKKVKIIEGSEMNIKITRQEDLILGEAILNRRAAEGEP